MRRHIIILTAMLLTVTSTGAMAEWTYLISADGNTFDIYIDKATIRKRGNVAKMWTMRDFKSPEKEVDGRTFFSQKTLREFDCVEIRRRHLTIISFSDNMGKGEVTSTFQYDNSKWQDTAPDSVGMSQWEAACKK